jgi:hypothetical protein
MVSAAAPLTNPEEPANLQDLCWTPSRMVGWLFSLYRLGSIMSIEALATNILSEEERLESLLMRRLGSRVRDLRVIVLPAGLILQGRTHTYHAKQIAQHTAMEVANMTILANEIEVL